MTRALLYLALTACGRLGFEGEPDGAPADDAVDVPAILDGTRLKAAYWEMDGVRLFAGWTDTLLNVDCGFVPVADGFRCLPYFGDVSHPISQQYPGYSDAACTTPSFGGFAPVEANACAPMPPMMMHSGRAYTIGARIQNAPYLMSGPTCGQFNGLYQWALSSPLEETAFVHATQQTNKIGDVIVGVITAEDGAQAPSFGFENAAGEQCRVEQRPGGTAVCAFAPKDRGASRDLSLNSVPTKIFADATCTTPAAIAGPSETPTYVHEVTAVPCGEAIVEDYDIGAEIPAGWANDEGVCTPISGWRYYLVGAKRPSSQTVLRGTWTRTGGNGHLHTTAVTIGGVRLPYEIWDDDNDAPCQLEQDNAGTIRCFPGPTPTTLSQMPVHRSADCSDATAFAYPMCSGAPTIQAGVFVIPSPECQAFGRRALSTAATTGLYRGSPGNCQAIAESLYFPDGNERPPSDFVAPVYRRGGS